MKNRNFMSLILAILILANIVLISACSDTSDKQAADTTAALDSTETTSGDDTTETTEPLEIPMTNYNGHTFNFLTGANVAYNYAQICVEELTGDAMNDAFYNRNLAVEDMLNIKITETATSDWGTMSNLFKNSITAGDRAYGAAFMVLNTAATSAVNGYCLNINELPYVDLSKSWWNQSATEQLSIGGDTYLVASDMSVSDKEVMWVLFFDKEHAEDLGIGDMYQMVKDGTWTFDKFYEYIQLGEMDVNGDGIMNMKDRYGLITHGENYMGMWMAAGETIASLNKDMMPEFTWGTERFSNVWDKIAKIMGSSAVYGSDIGFISSGLKNGNALFATEVVAFIKQYRENDREFGILPMPKYDEAQSDYYTYVALNSHLMVVGKDITDDDAARTGEILEAMAAKGKEILMPGYYDISLKSKAARDEESSEMLDIIFDSRMYDLGVVYGWGGVSSRLNSASANIASIYASAEKSMNKAMNKTLENFGY